jgi:CTP:molybdopterin cytidylyltransferase MocA
MGRLKQLLPWGETTIVAAAFDALAGHCGAGMVLVAGRDADAVGGALPDRAFELVQGDSDAEQIESARLGLRRALELHRVEWVFLHPADHPVIPAPVLDTLLDRAEAGTALIPTCRGRGGHPVLIPAGIAASILSWQPGSGGGGLRAYWETHPRRVQRVEFPDAPGLNMDLDSPEDYEAARRGRE